MIFGRFSVMAARILAIHVTLSVLAGAALFLIVDFVEVGNLAADAATTGELLRLSLMSLPRVLRLMLPVAAPIGVLTGLGALVRRREIEALLSAGAHPMIVLWPVLAVALAAASLHAVNAEWLIPPAAAEASAIRRRIGLSAGALERAAKRQSWFRGEDRVYRVGALADRDGTALERVIMLKVQDGAVLQRWDVAGLERRDSSWVARDTVDRRFGLRRGEDGALRTRRDETRPMKLREQPEDFVQSIAPPERLGLAELIATTEARTRVGRPAHAHRLELALRGAGPATVVLAMILAAAVALRLGRRQSLARALGAGAAIGVLTWFVAELASLFGSTGAASPVIAAWTVPALLILAGAVAWRSASRAGVSER